MSLLHIILALFGLGVLVFIHELGHYFVAKWCKMKVEVFSIGFGRALIRWKRGEVTWQVGWLPFGGYVKIKGMELTKKSKTEYVDPYTIEGGFFSKSPLKRMAVALAGPCANFILAFLIFCAMWAFGGREKPFAEFTQILGYVDPQSELYAEGLRPGDLLQTYDKKAYRSSKDLLYAALFSGKQVELTGAHIDWATGAKRPFTYSIAPYSAASGIEGMMTTGIGANASYLIYDQVGKGGVPEFVKGSPMVTSGIQLGDRLVWADGEYIFSMQQLSALINQSYALLTVERGGKKLLSRQPRITTAHLLLPAHIKGDLVDWQYEAGIKKALSHLLVLPYIVSDQGYIDGPLRFVDEESKRAAFPVHLYSALEKPLEPGDRIVAIDGVAFTTPSEMLQQLQEHKVHLIVQDHARLAANVSWKEEDVLFEKELHRVAVEEVAASIGVRDVGTIEGVRLLNPVQPLPLSHFTTPEQILAKRAEIYEKTEQSKREEALQAFDQEQQKKILGVYWQDRLVSYNPGPMALFVSVFCETAQTLQALIFGNLHPKWLSGPVGIVQVMHHGWQIGIQEALFWIAAISINLGFLNLLPIPVLDGGYICLALFEMITGRKITPKTMERLIIPFVVLLIGLLLFLTFQDVIRLF